VGRARILLLEFLQRDRASQRRSEPFPFLQGWARTRNFPVRWLAYGAEPPSPDAPFLMRLAPGDADALAAAIREFRPDHVVTNEESEPALAARLAAAAAGARWHFAGPFTSLDGKARSFLNHTFGYWSFFGTRKLLVDVEAPDYGCALGNAAARAIKPYVQLYTGPLCTYSRPLGRNPAYVGLDLSAAECADGCAFCGRLPPARVLPKTPPVELALRQIRAARATCPAERYGAHFSAGSSLLFLHCDRLFERVLEECLEPLTVLFTCRIDEFLRKLPALRALLPRLRSAGHAVGVDNMGVENFSAAENERLNKGITAEQALAAHDALTALEAAFPGTFRFHEYGGFSFILFTPWTTLADLRVNLEHAALLGLERGHFFFRSRLQLRPGRAITRLAARDGLVRRTDGDLGAHGDPVCLKEASDVELAWRFRDPRVDALFAISQAMSRWPDDDDPALHRALARIPAARNGAWPPPARLLRALVDAAEAGDGHDPVRLLAALGDEALAELHAARRP
jgi:hypothetical protein